jgi:hypothetical protein
MALYKYSTHLERENNVAFDLLHGPGATCPNAGIYRCDGCGREVASNAGDALPSQGHHPHTIEQGAIRWRLLVYAQN